MILKKHLSLGTKCVAILGFAVLPSMTVASAMKYHNSGNMPHLRGVASFDYSYDDTGAMKKRDARKYGDWRFQAFKLGLSGDVGHGMGYQVDYAWFRGRIANLDSMNNPSVFNHFLETYAYHKFRNGAVGQVGNTVVPFGNPEQLSYWKNIPFYTGFGLNFQPGLKFINHYNSWQVEVQLGKNSLVSADNARSYTPKLTRGVYNTMARTASNCSGSNVWSNRYTQNNEDSVQLAARVMKCHTFNNKFKVNFGLSLKGANTYNTVSSKRGTHWAGSLHVNGYINDRWTVQLQFLPYRYSPKYPGVDAGVGADDLKDTMQLGKDGVLYTIPTKANIWTAGLGYSFPVNWGGHVKEVTVYDDYSTLSGKTTKKSSKLNIVGFKFNVGPLCVNAEAVMGKNMVGVGNEVLSTGVLHAFNIGGSGWIPYNQNANTGAYQNRVYSDNVEKWKTKFNLHLAIKF